MRPGGDCRLATPARVAALVAAWVISLVACGGVPPGETPTGALEIRLAADLQARSIEPGADLAIDSFELVLEGAGSPVYRTVPGTERVVTADGLAEGEWAIRVDAANSGGTLIGRGEAAGTVLAGRTTTVDVEVLAVQGTGTLAIRLSWPEGAVRSPAIRAVLAGGDGAEEDVSGGFSMAAADGRVEGTYSATFRNGSYTLVLSLLDGTYPCWGVSTDVWIMSGLVSLGAFELSAADMELAGAISVAVGPRLERQFTMALSELPPTVSRFRDLTISALGGAVPDSREWYVDGNLQQESGPSLTLGPGGLALAAGKHRIDCVGRSGGSAASATAFAWVRDVFASRYDWGDHDTAGEIVRADDGFVLCGSVTVSGVPTGSLFKVRPDGSLQWQRTYGPGENWLSSVVAVPGGAFLAVGGAGGSDLWVVKLDSGGEVVWDRTHDLGAVEHASGVCETPDGGFIVAGSSYSSGFQTTTALLLRLDAAGTVLWQYAFGGGGYEEAASIISTDDGGCLVVGSTTALGAGNPDAWVLKLDGSGELQWQKAFGGPLFEWATSACRSAAGGYYVYGHVASSQGLDGAHKWLLRLADDGTLAWQKAYELTGGEFASTICPLAGGDLLLLGYSGLQAVRVDAAGSVLWARQFASGSANVYLSAALEDAGGGIVAAGNCAWGFTNLYDVVVIRMTGDGLGSAPYEQPTVVVTDTTAFAMTTHATRVAVSTWVSSLHATSAELAGTVIPMEP